MSRPCELAWQGLCGRSHAQMVKVASLDDLGVLVKAWKQAG